MTHFVRLCVWINLVFISVTFHKGQSKLNHTGQKLSNLCSTFQVLNCQQSKETFHT